MAHQLKKFKVTDGDSGGESFTEGFNKGEVMQDLQRMGCMSSGTTVEEVDPRTNLPIDGTQLPPVRSNAPMPPVRAPLGATEGRIFTIPGTNQKIKDINGTLYGLQWVSISKEDLISRIGCDDISPEGDTRDYVPMKIFDWVLLDQEKEPEIEIETGPMQDPAIIEKEEEDDSKTSIMV